MLITTIVSTVTAISGFVYGVRKDKKDLVSKSLSNLEYQITVYEKIIDSLRDEVMYLVKKVEQQEQIIISLQEKIDNISNRRRLTKSLE